MMKIPKIIHYVWVGGQEKNDLAKHCINSWITKCPDYEIMEWNEDKIKVLNNNQINRALKEKNWAYASDIIRVYALKEFGGVYLDTDVELTNNIDDLLNQDLFLSYESKYWFGSAVIGAKPNNEVVELLWKRYLNDNEIKFSTNVLCVHAWSAAVRYLYNYKPNGKTSQEEHFLALSSEYFFPIDYITLKENITSNTKGIHYYKGSWHNAKQRNSFNFAKTSRKIMGKHIFSLFERMVARNYNKRLRKEYIKLAGDIK